MEIKFRVYSERNSGSLGDTLISWSAIESISMVESLAIQSMAAAGV